jgi:hypothetical protein
MGENMDVREICHSAKVAEWQERIRACRSSGLNVKTWCVENGISPKTYYRWERICPGEAAKRLGYTGDNQGLIKVNPNQLPAGYACSGAPASAGTECTIRCGQVSIEVNSEMSVSRIADLVGALNSHV